MKEVRWARYHSIPHLKILSEFKDRDGKLWAGTFDKGIEVFKKKPNAFNFDKRLTLLLYKTTSDLKCRKELFIPPY
jgi:hypothetical protein